MKQPLVTVALLYGAGVVVGKLLEAPLLAAFLAAFALVLLGLIFTGHRLWLTSAAVFLFGWLNMTSRTAAISPIDLRVILQQSAIVSVRGQLASAPFQKIALRQGNEQIQTFALVDVSSIRTLRGGWQPAFGRVMAKTSGTLPGYFVEGQAVEIAGVASVPESPIVAGAFDYERYLHSRGIYHELKIESSFDWKTVGDAVPTPVSERFRSWAQRTLARGLPAPDESLRLQWAMLLGWQTALTPEVSEPFMRSGTMHIFAISGLHIALIAGIFVALFRALLLPRLLCGGAVIAIIWFYASATGWQASAIRSTVMMSVIIGGWMLKRPANLLNSLSTAACLILVWQPEQLFQASFQLSFFVVLSIALLSPRVESLKPSLLKPDPFLPWELRPWWQRQVLKIGDWLWTGFAASIAAFVGSVPLIAHYFHLFTPGSILANVVVVPISGLALISGLGALITGDVLPPFTEWFNNSGWTFMHLMIWLSEQASKIPGSWLYVQSPSPTMFFLYYGLLVAGCAGWLVKKPWRWIVIPSALILAITAAVQWQAGRSWHRLTVLPFHGAHAVCAQPAHGGDAWFVNCGDPTAVQFVVKPFWQANGGNHLENLVLTHGNSRYVGGAVSLHSVFPIRNVFVSSVPARSPRYREMLSDLEVRTRVHRTATNGAVTEPWQILHPSESERFANAADNSVVALGTFDGVRVLLVSELGRAGQKALFSRHPDLRADIVVAGAPGDADPPAVEWLSSLRPRLIVVADAAVTSSQEAHERRRLLRGVGAEVIQTHLAGAVTVAVRDGTWRISTARPVSDFEPEPEMAGQNVPGE